MSSSGEIPGALSFCEVNDRNRFFFLVQAGIEKSIQSTSCLAKVADTLKRYLKAQPINQKMPQVRTCVKPAPGLPPVAYLTSLRDGR